LSLTDKDGSIVVCISPLSLIVVEQIDKLNFVGITTKFVGDAQSNPSLHGRVFNGEEQLAYISPENVIQNILTYHNTFY